MAGGREAGGHIHHVLLGDAAVEQTVGEARVGQLLRGGGARQIGVHGHHRQTLVRQLGQRGAVCGARGTFDLGLLFVASLTTAGLLSARRRQLGQRGLHLLGVRRLAVPTRLVLHERHALALHRARDQRMGLARAIGLRRSERLHERGHVVAVHFARIPAEGLELRCEIARIAHIGRVAVDLQAVAVHDGHQVVEVAMRREHGSLPYLPFLAFAVAEQGEHALRLAVQLETGRGARRDGQALAERARGHLDARHEVRVGMALQSRAQLAQREQLLAGEVARLASTAYKAGAAWPFARMKRSRSSQSGRSGS